jgi:hypothetical protein
MKAKRTAKRPATVKLTDVYPPDPPEEVLSLVMLNKAVAEGNRERIEHEMVNLTYQFGCLFEKLENAGMIIGNGHHMAQALSQHVKEVLAQRWTKAAKP